MNFASDSPTALSASVLVLNRYYLAVHVTNVRRAFCLVYRDLAEVIHHADGQYLNFDFASWLDWSELVAQRRRSRPADARCDPQRDDGHDHDDWVRAVRFDILAPRVVRLLHYDRSPSQALRFNRRNILARDGHRCQYCGRHFPQQQLSLDHVVPRSRGGDTSWENIVCSCLSCNLHKGGRTPDEARMQLLASPRRPTQNPLVALKLRQPKYAVWRSFLPTAALSAG